MTCKWHPFAFLIHSLDFHSFYFAPIPMVRTYNTHFLYVSNLASVLSLPS